jgi:branched-chain amino acid transport system ATP-binding protein
VGAILNLDRVSKSFGAVVIATDLDLALAEGEALGMLGPNGAGKTTLFGIVAGTIAPSRGKVVFHGKDVTRLSASHRCRMGMARSFQVPQPFGGMTVFENLVVAAAFARGKRERDVYRKCARVLEDCELSDKANLRASSLTLLDRKRLELARALATEPRLLLLDEVAGGLSEVECEAQSHPRDGCLDDLDRAHRSCADCRSRPHRRSGGRRPDRGRRSSRRRSSSQSGRNLHGHPRR